MRRTLAILRISPFLIAALYVVYALLSLCGDAVWYMATQLLYQSPVMCILLLVLGRPFNFCMWWKMQCVVPVLPTLAAVYFKSGGTGSIAPCLLSVILLLILSTINGIIVFTGNETQQKL